jgi:hypothetical protein
MPAKEGFVSFRGYKVWYRIVGDREAPGKLPLLCLHGGPGGTHDYLEPLEAMVATGRRVIFYDQLGAGDSAHAQPFGACQCYHIYKQGSGGLTMKIFLTNQESSLSSLVPDFKNTSLSYNDLAVLREKETTVTVPLTTPKQDLSQCNFETLFQYAIFPRSILIFAAEWEREGRTMEAGDVIVQQAFLPPLSISIKAVFAVRVLEVFHSSTKVGFSYGTLEGHPESGISEFYYFLQGGRLFATIHTYSRPGLLISRLVAPLFTLPYQKYCTKKALERMRETFLTSNPQ